tara:strand:- start:4247 stop:4480 length:234 start_codon:yes stop_codon:yes gene_type:complete
LTVSFKSVDIIAMKLETFRVQNNLTYGKLAIFLGFGEKSNAARLVHRWCKGETLPTRNNIKQIKSRTLDKVSANDFF